MQELVTDLLVFSRFADEPFDGELLSDLDLDSSSEGGSELVAAANAGETKMTDVEQVPAQL